MAELLKLRQAARLIGVSPGRLYRAIAEGRLIVAPGGGPGKPTLVSLEAVQTFCQREGLHMPEVPERPERPSDDKTFHEGLTHQLQQAFNTMAAQYLARVVERQSAYIDAFVREELTHLLHRVLEGVVDQVVERVTERLERPGRSERSRRSEPSERCERSERSRPAITDPKAAVLQRLHAMQAEGLSLQAMANRFNNQGVPTLSGKGRWQKGTIGNLLAQEAG